MSGLFDSLFGSHSNANSNTQQSNQFTTNNLSPYLMQLLSGMLPGLMDKTANNNALKDSNNIRSIAGQLDNTGALNELIDSGISGAQSAATANFARTEGAQTGVMEQEMGGGKGNTFAQLVAGNSGADLQAQLAGIVASSKEQEATLDTTARTAAGQAYEEAGNTYTAEEAGPMNNLVALLNILKGGQQSGTSSGTSNTQGDQQNDPGLLQSIMALFGG